MNRHIRYKALFLLCFLVLIVIVGWMLFFFNWKPSQRLNASNLSREIEQNLSLPKGAHPLRSYNRFYAIGEGRDVGSVLGIFRYNPSGVGKIYIVSYKSLPAIFDGGCNVLTVRYSQAEGRVKSVECNGDS